jgi:hypothetical protein
VDIDHIWGGDLSVSPTGDIALVDGSDLTRQRILRRLMTSTHGYIWHPEYGAGVPQMIGCVEDVPAITSLIRSQIMLESAVSRNPLPQITVQKISDGLAVSIVFWDANSGTQDVLQFDYTV